MREIKWDWYGTWVWDYLNYERDSLYAEAWGAYDIWKEAYLKAHPEFSEEDDLELIENHYDRWTEPLFKSWIFRAWIWFYRPSVIIRKIVRFYFPLPRNTII